MNDLNTLTSDHQRIQYEIRKYERELEEIGKDLE